MEQEHSWLGAPSKGGREGGGQHPEAWKTQGGPAPEKLKVGGKWGTDGGPHKALLPLSRWGPALASPRKGASQDGAELSPACSRHTENICWRGNRDPPG